MKIIKRSNGNQRDAQTQGRTHCRVKNPLRCHDRAPKLRIVHHRAGGIETPGYLNRNRHSIRNAHGKAARHGQNERVLPLNRKNALFAGHDADAENRGVIASLIETCKLNNVDPHVYLTATLSAIVNGHKQSQIDDLLPWNLAAHV